MEGPGLLRTVKFGGFDQKDVLAYIDDLNSKISALETELNEAKANEGNDENLVDNAVVSKLEEQVKDLTQKYNSTQELLKKNEQLILTEKTAKEETVKLYNDEKHR